MRGLQEKIRFDRQISPATRIEVLTEGILTRRMQNDADLHDVGLIIFDEFHERSVVLLLCGEGQSHEVQIEYLQRVATGRIVDISAAGIRRFVWEQQVDDGAGFQGGCKSAGRQGRTSWSGILFAAVDQRGTV